MKKYYLIALIVYSAPTQTHPIKNALRFVANGLFYIIASSDAHERTTNYTQDLLKQLDPSQELLAVRSFNSIGKFLFGSLNTISIPYLNYVMIDDTIATLPEQEQRFVLGRSMVTLAHKHRYLGTKYLLPYVFNLLYELQISENQQIEHTHFNDTLFNAPIRIVRHLLSVMHLPLGTEYPQMRQHIKALPQKALDLKKPIVISTASLLFARYLSRSTEYELDRITADQFNCTQGAIKFLTRASWQAAENNSFFSLLIKYHIFPWYAKKNLVPPLIRQFPLLDQLQKPRSMKNITLFRPPSLEYLPQKLVGLAPGKSFDDVIIVPHPILMLVPYAQELLNQFPDYRSRVEALIDQSKTKQ